MPRSARHDRVTKSPLEDELAARSTDELAALLAKLATELPEAERQVRGYLLRGQPAAGAKRARTQLKAVLSGRQDFGWRGAATLNAGLNEVLDLIEQAVLPHDGPAAFALLRDFVASDAVAMERADDSNGEVSDPFRRACGLLARAAQQVPGPEARQTWEALIAGNDYGCRDALPELAATCLPAAELDRLIATLRRAMRTRGDQAFRAAVTLMGVARGRRDPDLYAEAAYRDAPKERHPAVALQVARQYLAASRPADAAPHMPASAELCGGYASDWHELKVALARALDDAAGVRAALWERFCFSSNPVTLADLLAVEPEAERGARRMAALDFIRADERDLPGRLRLLVAAGEIAEAAATAIARRGKLEGDRYFDLLPLAEDFVPDHPLAATVVFRALLDSILRRARPATYRHGAAYWQILEALAPRVTEWAPLPDHAAYVARVRTEHARKPAFWRAVQAHDSVAWARERTEERKLFEAVENERDFGLDD